MNRFQFWRWLTRPDPEPGFTVRKIGKLMLKSFLFAVLAVLLQTVLVSLEYGLFGTRFFASTWGTLLVVIAVYIPFARILSVDFAPPARRGSRGAARPGRPGRPGSKTREKKRKYAGVKKGGPRL